MAFEDLKSTEFQEKLKSANSPEEILALAKEAGIKLSDDELEKVAGGAEWLMGVKCPYCGKVGQLGTGVIKTGDHYWCYSCGMGWDNPDGIDSDYLI